MKVTMLLADAAEAINGKLYILGGGWSVTGPEPTPMAFAIKIEVPWGDANQRHHLRLMLYDEDGQPVMIPTPTGDQAVAIQSDFEVGRPPGIVAGTPLDLALAVNLAPLPLQPGHRYVWRCLINEEIIEEVTFSTRPQPAAIPPSPV